MTRPIEGPFTCRICGIVKLKEEFGTKTERGKLYYESWCIPCNRKYQKQLNKDYYLNVTKPKRQQARQEKQNEAS